MIKWTQVSCISGRPPWMAEWKNMTLFCQPWYGDGVKYRGIVRCSEWTLTLAENFTKLELAKEAVEAAASRMDSSK